MGDNSLSPQIMEWGEMELTEEAREQRTWHMEGLHVRAALPKEDNYVLDR